MSMQDPLADMFVRIKNAQIMRKPFVTMPSSKLKIAVVKLLKEEGYILDWQLEQDSVTRACSILAVYLKYHLGRPVIETLKRVSRPSVRVYRRATALPKVMNGLGIAIISTSKGIVSDRVARKIGQGGEVMALIT